MRPYTVNPGDRHRDPKYPAKNRGHAGLERSGAIRKSRRARRVCDRVRLEKSLGEPE